MAEIARIADEVGEPVDSAEIEGIELRILDAHQDAVARLLALAAPAPEDR